MNRKMEPIYLSVNQSIQRWPIGRTKFYELLGVNAFRTIKVGRRTLVEISSADAYFAGRPSAAPLRSK